MFDNKKIFILGMARSGYEVAKVLIEHNCEILITDLKKQDDNHVNELEKNGVKVIITETPENLLDNSFDYIIKNPGIKLDHPVCLKAKKLNIPITNEVEVAYNYLPKNITIIGVTGSNGKTTTTTLIYELLKHMGCVHLGGNIGYPVCSLVNKCKPNDIIVLEISGHQLINTQNFKTNISVMTNLSEVHIDHFGSYENYKDAKTLIFRNHTEKDIAILNKENKDVLNQTKNINSKKIYFSSINKSDIYINNGSIYYNDELIINLKDIKIMGIHNYENIMCAIAVVKQFNIDNEKIKEVLSNFKGVEHRIEYVNTINKRGFYNDSKSTNVKSTQIALNTFKKPTILLLGGLDRNLPFEPLEEYMNNVKAVVCYGQTKEKIKIFCDKINKKCIVVNNLKEAVFKAYSISNKNDIILLSPACASWDQYENFEQRGREFKKIVNDLK